ncbi:MAG: hypothetical protein Q9190_004577, partial [Brigantiaea leucoxantha]
MTPAKKPRKSKKPYVPKLRSGPYALILGLASIKEDEQISKQQLVELAQPHCDASFTATRDATTFYTAWNSMKTLLDKDLVKEAGRPQKRYSLTDEGWEAAGAIQEAVGRMENGSREVPTTGSSEPVQRQNKDFVDVEVESRLSIRHQSVSLPSANASHQDPDRPTSSRQRLGGMIADKFDLLGQSKKRNNFQEKSSLLAPPQWHSVQNLANTEDDAGLAARLQAKEDAISRGGNQGFIELLSSPEPESKQVVERLPSCPRDQYVQSSQLARQPTSNPIHEKPSSIHPPQNMIPQTFTPIHLAPGTFTVELLVDNREVHSREDRSYITKELQSLGIFPTVRSLPLGDFFWVARPKDPDLLTRHGEEPGSEIALDYIVERKRLDDLVSSITDGRFREQKFRLRKTGVRNVIYLIEEIAMSSERKANYHDAVQSAIAGTQVIDGFFVKRTSSIAATVKYLASLTRLLTKIYT